VNTIIDVMLHVVRVLDELGVEYVLVGSVASSARGFPRSTNDADIVADLRLEHADRLVASLRDGFYIDPDAVARAIVCQPIPGRLESHRLRCLAEMTNAQGESHGETWTDHRTLAPEGRG
jgi:hypothetical protein